MHTSEQAKDLWCPMARVAQIGAAETNATYNRAYIKAHVPVKLMNPDQELNLGEDAKVFMATVLETEIQISAAARCIGGQCAMWRLANDTHGYCGLAPIHKATS